MAGEKIIEKPEPGATGLKLESVTDLGELEVASGKDEILSKSTSSIPSLANANSSTKGETDHESVGEQGVYHPPTSCYNYYYPGSNGSFTQSNDSYNLHADGSHTGVQSENGSLVYYLPGYNPYTSGTLVGADGQCAGQQQYFPSSGYLQPPVSYASEAVPCYSWDLTFVGDLPNVTAAGFANAKCAPGSTAFAKSNGFYSMKTNSNPASKFPKSTAHAQPIRTINKVPRVGSDFSRGLLKDYHPIGKFSPFTYQKQGLLPHDGQANYRQSGRVWNLNDRYKSSDKYNRNVDFETLIEVTRGPRAYAKTAPLGSSSTNEKEELGFSVRRDRYNLQDFQTDYETAKFYIIKSYSEDDIHKSIKYDVWSSTPNGNKKLDAVFRGVEGKASEKSSRCPVFLFFSVNGSGQFLGIAEMVGQVDFNKDMEFWQLDKWNGFFPVKWHIIKDVPNSQLRHIILENNDNRPVTFTRDTQEIGLKQGLEMLSIFKSYAAKTSLLDDFNFYENRAKSIHSQSIKPSSQQNEMYSNGDIPNLKTGERNIEVECGGTKRSTDPSCLVNRTKNLSLNDSPQKSNSVKSPSIVNLIPSAF
ncbi:hypothetical protein F2P56_028685 [Juglans regia]|uniref:YTH domain-containing family protein n=2 Tax=Juglans regia TaxID=51240 RepID=A0A833TWR3_JUGRE|nr:YTH domain-containing protein ECT4-like isoform X1 [Juglans regia]KAF5448122.1 hypothetical protein F2P56_028685 [Juglans regia]